MEILRKVRFRLRDLDRSLPAGIYEVVIDEESSRACVVLCLSMRQHHDVKPAAASFLAVEMPTVDAVNSRSRLSECLERHDRSRMIGGAMMWLSWLRLPSKTAKTRLTFPNHSRSYDVTQRGVRFWGYDRSMETSFLVTIDAFRCMVPGVRSHAADLLGVFDINRDRIYAVAGKAYAREPRTFCKLIAADFS